MSGCSNENTWLLGCILKSFRKYLLSISVPLHAYCMHLLRLFHHQIWLEKEHVFFFKMASNSLHQRRTLATDEVINALFADDDSDDEFVESSSESKVEEISSDEETNTSVTIGTDATNGRGQQNSRGPRTRGGISRVLSRQQAKEKEEEALEAKRKEQDKAPTVPSFTSDSKINVPLSDDPNPLEFLDLFLDDAFYYYITTQTNIYADQYLSANPELSPHARYQQWKSVTSAKTKKFVSLYLLTGIIRKLLISQYWSSNPLNRTPFFKTVMS